MTSEALALQTTPIITFGYFMQVLLSLMVVLGLLFIAARYVLPKFKISNSSGLIKVVDRVYLEPQVAAYLLKVGQGSWLITVSNKNICRIDRVDNLINE